MHEFDANCIWCGQTIVLNNERVRYAVAAWGGGGVGACVIRTEASNLLNP